MPAGRYMAVDISDAMETIRALRSVHTQEQIEKLMYRTFKRTGGTVRKVLRTELPKDYEVKPSWVGKQVGNPKTMFGGLGNVSCSIPIKGTRGTIGGRFKASGGAHGWKSMQKRYKINAKIVKANTSTLPSAMTHQGGNPPFRNLKSKLGNTAFTRKTTARLPIVRVAGIGVPQMPLNRSRDDVEANIMSTLMKRLEHEHKVLINKWCRK